MDAYEQTSKVFHQLGEDIKNSTKEHRYEVIAYRNSSQISRVVGEAILYNDGVMDLIINPFVQINGGTDYLRIKFK